MGRVPIDLPTARQIKGLLWKGTSQERVAVLTGASQSTISRIKAGKAHENVPWPDGSLGPMPESQTREPEWSADASRLLAFPDMMQQRIFAVVNEARRNSDQPEIPPTDTTYLDYLDAEGGDQEWEASALLRAREAEDKRLSLLMIEFDEIVAEERTVLHEESARAIIVSTRQEPLDEVIPITAHTDLPKGLEWDYVKEFAPKHPLVIEAFETSDPHLIRAICIVFEALQQFPHNWGEPFAIRNVRELADKLRGETIDKPGEA